MTEVPAVQFPKNGVLVYDPDVTLSDAKPRRTSSTPNGRRWHKRHRAAPASRPAAPSSHTQEAPGLTNGNRVPATPSIEARAQNATAVLAGKGALTTRPTPPPIRPARSRPASSQAHRPRPCLLRAAVAQA